MSSSLWFAFRATCFRLRRLFLPPRPLAARLVPGQEMLPSERSRSTSALYTDAATPMERLWQLGKVQNLRLAVRSIHGVRLEPGQVFSFWAQVGPPLRLRGFVAGRELREGCLIPNIGGGLCQLSNALHDAALKAGLEIIERHRHTQIVPGSLAETGRDATVFWNYVDLRFRAPFPISISAVLDRENLLVRLASPAETLSPGHAPASASGATSHLHAGQPENCASCGVAACLRHVGPGRPSREKTAVLLDAYWPEFDRWLQSGDRDTQAPELADATLALPLRFSCWRQPAYRWSERNFLRVADAPEAALPRAFRSRRLATQGAARQRALLRMDETLALALARRIPHTHSRAIVAQTLLPHLWRHGWLGGRHLAVTLTRWPLRLLQERLDRAARLHPESPTLADFRTDPALAETEWEALENASHLVTPHAALATIWPAKTTLLPWVWPENSASPAALRPPSDGRFLFPATTLGRKGAYELRAAARALHLPLALGGRANAESGPAFWDGLDTRPAPPENGPGHPAAVILPAWIEHQPRRLLAALAAGHPVVATPDCGLHGCDPARHRLSLVPCGDSEALKRILSELLANP